MTANNRSSIHVCHYSFEMFYFHQLKTSKKKSRFLVKECGRILEAWNICYFIGEEKAGKIDHFFRGVIKIFYTIFNSRTKNFPRFFSPTKTFPHFSSIFFHQYQVMFFFNLFFSRFEALKFPKGVKKEVPFFGPWSIFQNGGILTINPFFQ